MREETTSIEINFVKQIFFQKFANVKQEKTLGLSKEERDKLIKKKRELFEKMNIGLHKMKSMMLKLRNN